jgi:hypothetical protein
VMRKATNNLYQRKQSVQDGQSWSLASLYLIYIPPPTVRIRVRIDPPHPLVCRKRRLDGAVLRMRPE